MSHWGDMIFAASLAVVIIGVTLLIAVFSPGTSASQRCTEFCGSRHYIECTADAVRCGEEAEK